MPVIPRGLGTPRREMLAGADGSDARATSGCWVQDCQVIQEKQAWHLQLI